MKLKKIIIIVLIAIAIININSKVFAKYVFEYTEKAAILEIDRTAPILEIIYSTKDITSNDVEVKIIANEKIQEPNGWKLLDDGKTLVKKYSENQNEKVIVKDLSGNETETNIIVDNIDKEPPTAQIIDIINTNKGYEKYANKTHKITVRIEIKEKNLGEDEIKKEEVLIMIDEKEVNNYGINIKEIEKTKQGVIYDIELTNLNFNGLLKIKFIEGSIIDKANLKNEEKVINTEILLDNVAPVGSFKQEISNEGAIMGIIQLNEEIRNVEGWSLSNDRKKLINQFLENKYYKLVISDYAGNTFDVEFNVNSIANTTTIQNSNNLENAENEDDINKKAALILLDCLTKFGQWCCGNTN